MWSTLILITRISMGYRKLAWHTIIGSFKVEACTVDRGHFTAHQGPVLSTWTKHIYFHAYKIKVHMQPACD